LFQKETQKNKKWRDPEMKTGNVGNTSAYENYQKVHNPPAKVFDQTTADMFKAPVDSYTPTVKGAADPATIQSLWAETNHMGDAVRKLIASALGVNDANGQGFWALRSGNFKLSEADRAQAQQLISEDGFFGVKQTTDRIMNFARAMVGEGASDAQIETMRKAVQKGFDEVARMFGGFDKLPDVTKQTHTAIMKEFDDWKAGNAK